MSGDPRLTELQRLVSAQAADAREPLQSAVHDVEVYQMELELQNRELREAQLQLEEARARYADLYDFAPIAYCSLDEHGRVEEANLTASELFAVPHSQLKGKPLTANVNMDDPTGFRAQLRAALREGADINAEINCRLHGREPTAMRMSGGVGRSDPRFCRVAFIDISDEKRRQKKQRLMGHVATALASSLDYTATVGDAVCQAVPLLADVCFVDVLEGAALVRIDVAFADAKKREHCSAARTYILPGLDGPGPQRDVLSSGQALHVPAPSAELLDHAAKRGAALPSAALVLPLLARGRAIGVLSLMMAESGRKYASADIAFAVELAAKIGMAVDNGQLYRAAQRAVKSREEILSIVSHDLRSPLSSILLNTQMLLKDPPEGERRRGRRAIESVRRSAARMTRLVDDLLDMSNIDGQRLSLYCASHDVTQLLRDAADAMAPLAKERGVKLTLSPFSGALGALCDRERVMQVFANLIGNALKFTPRGGAVTLRAEERGGEIAFEVRDTGPGIANDDLQHIFDRHWHAPQGSSGGCGLGLFISKGIVEMQGGAIAVDTELGKGTSFRFTLPSNQVSPADRSDDNVGVGGTRSELPSDVGGLASVLREVGSVGDQEATTSNDTGSPYPPAARPIRE